MKENEVTLKWDQARESLKKKRICERDLESPQHWENWRVILHIKGCMELNAKLIHKLLGERRGIGRSKRKQKRDRNYVVFTIFVAGSVALGMWLADTDITWGHYPVGSGLYCSQDANKKHGPLLWSIKHMPHNCLPRVAGEHRLTQTWGIVP